MHKNKILEKLLAIVLIFTLTSAHSMFVTKSFATSLAETLFGVKSDTGHENVGFEAYFGTEEEKVTSVISDVNNEELAISIDLSVKEAGYLKDAKVEVIESEEGKGLNFELKPYEELPEYVQGVEENTIYFQQINSSEDSVKVSLPIEYKNEKYVNENKFSSDAIVRFTGVYVDDDGEDNEVSRDINLNVSWIDSREVRLESDATKLIDYGKGVILQTVVRVDNSTDKNTLPVKSSEVTVDVPTYEGVKPSNVTVVANSTMGTNGKGPGSTEFNSNNWYYDQELNQVKINVSNEKQHVVVNDFEDEYLKEAGTEVVEDDRYYNVSGIDEYLLTYTYEDVKIPEAQEVSVNSNIAARLTTFSGVDEYEGINIVTNSNEFNYNLAGQTGNIVSLNIENETESISKAYAYHNYNGSNYEKEISSKMMINVSHKDLVEGLYLDDLRNNYTTVDGVIENDDIYVKQISISRDNFNEILGEDGKIVVYNGETELYTFNKDSQVDESNMMTYNFDSRVTKARYEISKPVGEGNLVIGVTRGISNVSIDKATLLNVDSVATDTMLRAKYQYVDDPVEVWTAYNRTALTNTTTEATLKLDRDSLSTLATNNDVEIRIELNNATDVSDPYGHSVYQIEFPENVEQIDVTTASMLYEEGLSITSCEVNGNTVTVVVDGVQNGINSGVLTNGTTIVLNANIKVNLYTPAKSDVIKLNYSNDQATNYKSNGYGECVVNYSAPTGLITVNSTMNYNNVGSSVTSIRQGTKSDVIDIYSDAKVATMEIVVMNNNDNKVSDVAVLGRIPFNGVKDIATGEELGTTLDTRMVSGLVADEHNSTAFDIYYSENGEATKDLTDANNGWTLTPETLDNVKSYLIVPQDENYEMDKAEIIRFTYEYEIPANLGHNENIYGTFLAYYTNQSEVSTTEEQSTPDLVGLTTGKGPDLNLKVTSTRNNIREYEELRYTVSVENVGEEVASDVNVEFRVPEYTEFISAEVDKEGLNISYADGVVRLSIPTMELQDKVSFDVVLNVVAVGDTTNDIVIKAAATCTAKDLGTTKTAEAPDVNLNKAEFEIKISNVAEIDEALEVQKAGAEFEYKISVLNLLEEERTNTVVSTVLPDEISFVSGGLLKYEADGLTSYEDSSVVSYDEATRVVSFNIGTMDPEGYAMMKLHVKVNELGPDRTKGEVVASFNVKADGTETYGSNSTVVYIGRPEITINQSTDNIDTYVKEGDTIKYTFTVKNEGGAVAEHVKVTDVIPDGIAVRKITYTNAGVEAKKKVSSSREAVITSTIAAGEEMVISIEAVASNLGGAQEKTVTNYATVSSNEVQNVDSNSITHIVEASEKNLMARELQASTSSTYNGTTSNTNIEKTYRIDGVAWADADKDGVRSSEENTLSGVVVRLVSSESGVIQNSITTDSNGQYSFNGVTNGNYLIIFDYDTVKYTTTQYKKDGVGANVNSDAVTTKIEQDGRSRNAAITDVITVSNGSVSNVDIGLVLADKFDLELTTGISKVTMIGNGQEPKTDVYENVSLAKTEVAARYVSGAVVRVQYEITVANKGDVAGYAKRIVDYLPEGMTFNSSLEANSIWYTGTDGNIYTTALAEKQLAPGETAKISLVLTKEMTADNTGLVNNLVEIADDYNIYGISDCNSTPLNKAQGENDIGSADVIILIKTGETLVYTSVIITTIILGIIVVFMTYTRIVLKKKKGGV